MSPKKYTRREMLSWSAGTLLAAGLWPGLVRAEDAPESEAFTFIALNDLHYSTTNCAKWFGKVLETINKSTVKPDFCLIIGDLADNGTPEQLGAIRDLFATLRLPIHRVIGNHDYYSQSDRKAYEDIYPGELNYFFEHKGWQFFGLDTTQGQQASNTVVSPATLQWLDASLPKYNPKAPTVVFTHFPMGPVVPSRPLNADDLLDRFRRFNLQSVFCGHFHASTERQIRAAAITTNRCCSFIRNNHDGTKEKGYFLCHAEGGRVRHSFVEVTPV